MSEQKYYYHLVSIIIWAVTVTAIVVVIIISRNNDKIDCGAHICARLMNLSESFRFPSLRLHLLFSVFVTCKVSITYYCPSYFINVCSKSDHRTIITVPTGSVTPQMKDRVRVPVRRRSPHCFRPCQLMTLAGLRSRTMLIAQVAWDPDITLTSADPPSITPSLCSGTGSRWHRTYFPGSTLTINSQKTVLINRAVVWIASE